MRLVFLKITNAQQDTECKEVFYSWNYQEQRFLAFKILQKWTNFILIYLDWMIKHLNRYAKQITTSIFPRWTACGLSLADSLWLQYHCTWHLYVYWDKGRLGLEMWLQCVSPLNVKLSFEREREKIRCAWSDLLCITLRLTSKIRGTRSEK